MGGRWGASKGEFRACVKFYTGLGVVRRHGLFSELCAQQDKYE